ncbi:MAG: hypothetical protein RMJ56_08375 [Gemmataceae bacterium]|nr:cytochrome c maturation protein CcmE [Gemmata sp.]MDW8197607.1 hypothetical protein [Gemmataceae bacterium]
MSSSLATLPWVEKGSIKTDAQRRHVKFTVTDRSQFNMDELRQKLGSRYSSGVQLIAGPTEP